MSKKSIPASPRKTAATAEPKKTTPKRAARSTPGSASESVPDSEPLIESEFVQTAVTLRLQGSSSDWQPKPGQPAPARSAKVHDFSGYVVFALPPELKETLGEAVFKKCMADLENHEVTAIHREKDSITYVRMRCVAQMYKPERDATDAGKTSPSSKGRNRGRA